MRKNLRAAIRFSVLLVPVQKRTIPNFIYVRTRKGAAKSSRSWRGFLVLQRRCEESKVGLKDDRQSTEAADSLDGERGQGIASARSPIVANDRETVDAEMVHEIESILRKDHGHSNARYIQKESV